MNTFKVVRLATVTNSLGVPQDLGPSTSSIRIRDSSVLRLNRSSLASYPMLLEFRTERCGLEYIDEGAFDYNPLLENLEFIKEPLKQLPANLGPAQTSLKGMKLNRVSTSITNLIGGNYFREFPNLSHLSIADNNDLGPELNVDILPRQLTYLYMSNGGVELFPDLSAVVPGLKHFFIQDNYIQVIPQEFIATLNQMKVFNINNNLLAALPDLGFMKRLKTLYANNNQLTRLPDMYHLPLENLRVATNPLVCDQALCWLRMWPFTKTPILEDRPTCAGPGTLAGIELMGVQPVDMECYNGKYNDAGLTRSIIFQSVYKNIPQLSWGYRYELNVWFMFNVRSKFDLCPFLAMTTLYNIPCYNWTQLNSIQYWSHHYSCLPSI